MFVPRDPTSCLVNLLLLPAGASQADLRRAVFKLRTAVPGLTHEGTFLVVSVRVRIVTTDAMFVAARGEQAFLLPGGACAAAGLVGQSSR